MHSAEPLLDYRDHYLRALLDGDESAAASWISHALDHGIGVAHLYLDVLMPAQVEVGERWHRGELNVAQEHLATQITRAQMERLRARAPTGRSNGLRAVVAAVEEELHDLGARVVAEFLHIDGWEVDFLGANTPTQDFIAFVQERAPKIVVLSVTLARHLSHAARVVDSLRQLPQAPPVLLGGLAVATDPEAAAGVGADLLVHDAWEAVHQARTWAVPGSAVQTLDRVLIGLGERLRIQRRAHGWSQLQLAEAAGLDRSYVNAAELGKQNLTLGAILKLASALDVPLEDLLFSP